MIGVAIGIQPIPYIPFSDVVSTNMSTPNATPCVGGQEPLSQPGVVLGRLRMLSVGWCGRGRGRYPFCATCVV